VFTFGGFPFALLNDSKFIPFLAGAQPRGNGAADEPADVVALCEPLLTQLEGALRKEGVHRTPELVEVLVRCCVTREPTDRLTFQQISQRTNRANTVGLFSSGVAAATTLPKGTNLQLHAVGEQQQRLRADSFC
jgi:hypothetical protein